MAASRHRSEGPLPGCDAGKLQQPHVPGHQATKPEAVVHLEKGKQQGTVEREFSNQCSPDVMWRVYDWLRKIMGRMDLWREIMNIMHWQKYFL